MFAGYNIVKRHILVEFLYWGSYSLACKTLSQFNAFIKGNFRFNLEFDSFCSFFYFGRIFFIIYFLLHCYFICASLLQFIFILSALSSNVHSIWFLLIYYKAIYYFIVLSFSSCVRVRYALLKNNLIKSFWSNFFLRCDFILLLFL